MSYCEHTCKDCGHMVFNNDSGPSVCPKCGGDMMHACDEVFERREDDSLILDDCDPDYWEQYEDDETEEEEDEDE